MNFVIKIQTRQNVEKNAKCGDFSDACANAKLMINFFWPKYEFFFILHRKVVDTKSLKLAENGKKNQNVNCDNFRVVNDRYLIFNSSSTQ